MTNSRPRLILHVGQHKTGSKALQSFLAQNRDVLRQEGILYPAESVSNHGIRAYSISHFRLHALLRREAIAECQGEPAAAAYWAQYGPFCQPFDATRDLFADFDTERRQFGLRQVVLSAEDLCDMHTAHEIEFRPEMIAVAARRLAALAIEFDYEPRVVMYLRRQDHLLGAHYVQFIKGSPENTHDFAEFTRLFAPRLDAHGILDRWSDSFGKDAIQVRTYEKMSLPDGIVPDFFAHVLKMPVPAACRQPVADVESVNMSLGRDQVEFIRLLNRRFAAGLPVYDRAAVLEAALNEPRSVSGPTGIAGWLAPAARRDLLESFQAGNAAIAQTFLQRTDNRLFVEPWPANDENYQVYNGLSPERTLAIALAIQASI